MEIDTEPTHPSTHRVLAYTVRWRRSHVGVIVASDRDEAWSKARDLLISRGYSRVAWRLWADVQPIEVGR